MENLKKIAFGVFAMMFALVNVHAATNGHYAHITNATGVCTIQDEDDFAAAMEWDYTRTNDACYEFVINSEVSITKEVNLDNISIRIDNGGKLTVDGGKLIMAHRKNGPTTYSIKLNDAAAELNIINGGYVEISEAQGDGVVGSVPTVGIVNIKGANSTLKAFNLGGAGVKNTTEINVSDNAVLDTYGMTMGGGISTEGTLKVSNATVTANGNKTGIYAKVITEGNSNIQVNDNTRIGLTLTDDSVIGGTTSVEATGNGPEDARADLAIDVDNTGHAPIIADSASVVTDSIVKYTEWNGATKGTIWNIKVEGDDAYLAYNTNEAGTKVMPTKGVVKKENTVTVYSSTSKEITVENGVKVINNSGDDITVKVNNSDDTFVLASGDTKTIKATVKEPEQEPTTPTDPTNPADQNQNQDQTANVGDENAQQTPADATEAPNTNTVPKTGDNIVSIMGLGLASIVITAVSAKNLKKQTVR